MSIIKELTASVRWRICSSSSIR